MTNPPLPTDAPAVRTTLVPVVAFYISIGPDDMHLESYRVAAPGNMQILKPEQVVVRDGRYYVEVHTHEQP